MGIVTPEATLIASTSLEFAATDTATNNGDGTIDFNLDYAVEKWMGVDEDASDAETLMEFGGRGCYLSWHKPNPATAKNADYLKRTVFDMGHGSIAEHATATLYLTGVSRALLAEISRHRHLSFSVLSQRFVNEEDSNIVIPPAFSGDKGAEEYLQDVGNFTREAYVVLVDDLVESGLPRKQAREAARGVLPNMTETRILVTGNMRTWAEVLVRRSAPDADAEFREVSGLILDALTPVAPAYFGIVRDQIEAANDTE